MTPLVQPSQAKLAPPLPPLLDAIQMHAEFVSGLLKRQTLAQAQNPLGSHPCPRVWMKNAHLT
jgi:hypothetical protein